MFRDLPPYAQTTQNPFWSAPTPSHWSVQPGLAVLQENRHKNDGLIESQVLSLSYGKVVVKPVEQQRGLVPDSYEGYQILDPGDIVVRPTDLQNDQTSIRVGHVKDRGIITSAYIGLRPTGAWGDSYAYLYLTVVDSSKRIYGMGSGLRQQLGWSDLKRMPCLVPPAEEQVAIVKYLAHANARIDKAIAAKRRLIALLREQRVQRRHELILKGLEPSVRFRESGIKWIGNFPEHWKIVRVKQLTQNLDSRRIPLDTVERGKMSSRIYDYYGASGVIDKVEDYIFDETLVLLAEDGANLVLRNLPLVSRVDGKFWVNNHAHVLRVVSADVDYLVQRLELLDYRPWITGAAQPKLTGDRLMSIPISMPPLDEQRSIMEQLSTEFAEIDTARERLSAEIELLQEFRTRLVADVVTGQVDVRAIAATLPDAPESFDNTVSATDDDLEEALSEGEE